MKAERALGGGIAPACLAFCLYAAPALAETPSAPGAPPASAPGEPVPGATDPAAAPLPSSSSPPRYDLPSPGTRWAVLGTGVAVTGVSYGLALGASYAWPHARTADELRLPVVGPWMAIADTGCKKSEPDCSTVLLIVTALFTGMDGVIQAGGVGIAIESLFLPTSSSKPREARRSASPSVRPVPYVAGGDGVGLGIVGTF